MLVELRTQGFEAGRVFERRFRIVDRAWTDDHQQAIVATVEYVLNFAARVEGSLRRVVAGGQFRLYFGRRGNRTDRIDSGDRKGVGEGKSVAVRGDPGWRRLIQKKKK